MTRALAVAAAVGLAFAAAPARADEPAWYRGVPKDKQARAYELFKKGNKFFEQNEYAKAAELYLEALAIWDHPGIHFNLVVSLVNLDRLLEAYAHLEGAMKYGIPGLETPTRFKEAQTYKVLLEGRLVTFTAETTQDGVEVTLDGKLLAKGKPTIVMPGAHALVATKPGFETMTKNLTLLGGAVTEHIVLAPRQRRVKVVRRYRTWMPWTVVGIGAGVSLAGGATMLLARRHQDRFEDQFAAACPDGCALEEPGTDVDWGLRDRATLENRIGLGVLAAGGAALVTGLVLVALNSPREVELRDPIVTVTATPTDVGVTWLGRF